MVDISAYIESPEPVAKPSFKESFDAASDAVDDGKLYKPVAIHNLLRRHKKLHAPVIHGLVREGETINVIAQSKMGKSWMVLGMAIAMATGGKWLGYHCEQGNVLIVDNELHQATSSDRLRKVMDSMNVSLEDVIGKIDVLNLRGKLLDLEGLSKIIIEMNKSYKVIILDAFYRFIPKGMSENDNASMANLFNVIDHMADSMKCSFVVIHHSSKGDQSGKDITDVGAGAGSISRATDTHLILRRHTEDDVVVMDGVTRSFAPLEPRCLRWNFPLWLPADDQDPGLLKLPRAQGERKQDIKDQKAVADVLKALNDSDEPMTVHGIGRQTGFGKPRVERLLAMMIGETAREVGYRKSPQGKPVEVYAPITHAK